MAIEHFVPVSGGFGFGSRTFGFVETGSEGCGGIWPRRKSSRSLYVPGRKVVSVLVVKTQSGQRLHGAQHKISISASSWCPAQNQHLHISSASASHHLHLKSSHFHNKSGRVISPSVSCNCHSGPVGVSTVFFASTSGTARAPAYLVGGGGGKALFGDVVVSARRHWRERWGATYNMPKDIYGRL